MRMAVAVYLSGWNLARVANTTAPAKAQPSNRYLFLRIPLRATTGVISPTSELSCWYSADCVRWSAERLALLRLSFFLLVALSGVWVALHSWDRSHSASYCVLR